MNILLVNKYWRNVGGVEEYSFQLARMFTERGHRVIPFSQLEVGTIPNEWSDFFVTPVDPLDPSLSGKLKAARRAIIGDESVTAINRLLDVVDIDAVHVVHIYHQLGPALLRSLKRRDIPIVMSVHDYKLCCPSYRLFDDSRDSICVICKDAPRRQLTAPARVGCWKSSRLGGAFLGVESTVNRSLRRYTANVDRLLVSNELMKSCAISAGFDQGLIRILPNSWPMPSVSPIRDAPTAGEFLFVGRLVREKGVDVLIRAAAITQLPVRVIGDGPMLPELQSLAAELGAPVNFLGRRFGDKVEQEMGQALSLIVPSKWHEVSPLVVYQAMALGCPVIASRVGGLPDLLEDGRGVLVGHGDVQELARAMRDAATDPMAVNQLAQNAHAFARKHLSPEAFAANMSQIYAELGVAL